MDLGPKLLVALGLTGELQRRLLLRKYREVFQLGGLAERRQALWLAPTQAVARQVREELTLRGAAAILDPGVTTFAGFAAGVVRDLAIPRRAISNLQRRRVVRRVIADAAEAGGLKYFAPVGGSTGLVNLVDETIVRLKRRDVSAREFAKQQRRGGGRQRELAALYTRYEGTLSRERLLDGEGVFQAARDWMLAESEVATGLRLVVVDRFTEFTTAQLEILRLVAARAERVVVTLPGEGAEHGRQDLFARTLATQKQLIEELGGRRSEVGEESAFSIPPSPFPLPHSPPWPALEHLQRNLFRSYRQLEPISEAARESLDRVEIIAASSMRAEIEEIARRVKGLLVSGAAPGDVVVAFRSTHDVADRVRQAFDDFGIPFVIDASRRLSATPLVRSLLNVLRLQVDDWPYRRVLQVVGDRSLRWWEGANGEWGMGNGERGGTARVGVEWLVRQGQQPTGREELLALVGEELPATEGEPGSVQRSLFGDDDDETLVDVDPFGDDLPGDDPFGDDTKPAAGSQSSRLVSDLAGRGFDAAMAVERLHGFAALLNELPRQAAIGKWIDVAERLAGKLGLLVGAAERQPTASPRDAAQESGRREWAILVEGLQSAAHADAWAGFDCARLTLAEFVDLVATTAAELPAPEPHDATGCVRVLSAENARHVRPRHLLLGGLSEQAFPVGRRHDVNEDAPEDVAASAAAEQAPDQSEQAADARSDEMLLFFQTVTSPTETLTLSYPALDAKAQSLPASPFLVELERAFGDAAIKKTVQSLSYEHQHGDIPLSRSDVRRHAVLGAQQREQPSFELLAALVRSPRYSGVGSAILEGIDTVASRGDRKTFGRFDGVFLSDAARARLLKHYGPDYIWSPSRLETYAACPFRFFGEHLLKLEPLPELALESDLARRGSLLHETLSRLYGLLNAAAKQGGATTPEEVAAKFQATLDWVVGERPRRGLDRALVEIERRQIAAWAEQFARQHDEYSAAWPHLDGAFKATYFEARFGPKNRRSESTDDAALSTDQPFEVEIGAERVRFTGQIDRIDVGQIGGVTVFNVIDYKTSAKQKVDHEKMKAGLQLQLPLYALAVAELLLADQEAVGLSAGYWSIRGKGFAAGARSGGPLPLGEVRNGVLHEAAAWPELKGLMLARIGEIVAGIRQGWFPVYNDDKECGKFCPLNTGCRIAHVRSLEKIWIPPIGGEG